MIKKETGKNIYKLHKKSKRSEIPEKEFEKPIQEFYKNSTREQKEKFVELDGKYKEIRATNFLNKIF